jgi:hypothetical protein
MTVRPLIGACACAIGCALLACADMPGPRRVELDACQRDPLCSRGDTWTPDERCVVREGCALKRPGRDLPPCASSENAVRVEKFVERPDAFQLPVTLWGRLEVRPACEHNQPLFEQPCGMNCYGFMALVASLDERDLDRRRTRVEMLRDPLHSEVVDRMVAEGRPPRGAKRPPEGVALVGAQGVPVGCVGDNTAICCEYPIDGRDVRATFTHRLERQVELPSGLLRFREIDYDRLVLERICVE